MRMLKTLVGACVVAVLAAAPAQAQTPPPPSRGRIHVWPPMASTSWRQTNSPIPAPDAARLACFVR